MGFSSRFPRTSRAMKTSGKVLAAGAVVYMVVGFAAVRLVKDPVHFSPVAAGTVALPPLAATAEGPGRTVVKGAISVHTGRSHDAEGTLEEVAAAAAEADLDFVVLGDHVGDWAAQGPAALAPRRIQGVLLLPGHELAVEDAGRVLAVGLDTLPRDWKGTVEELVDRVHATDGFLSVVHPRSSRDRERWKVDVRPGIDAWESFDVSEMARLRQGEPLVGYRVVALLTGLVIGQGQKSLTRFWREGTGTPALLAYDSVRAQEHVALTGGLNHHPKARILGSLFPAYQPFFRTVVNHLDLDAPLNADPAIAQRQILDALRRGDLFVTLGDARDVEDFGFLAVGSDGSAVGMSDVGCWPGEGRLVVSLPSHGTGTLPVRILRDGKEVAWLRGAGGERLQWPVPGPGVYRVEVFKGGWRVGGLRVGFQPWILSNPVELQVPGPERVAGGT